MLQRTKELLRGIAPKEFSFIPALFSCSTEAWNPQQNLFTEHIADAEREGADDDVLEVDVEGGQRREEPRNGEEDFHVEVVDGIRRCGEIRQQRCRDVAVFLEERDEEERRGPHERALGDGVREGERRRVGAARGEEELLIEIRGAEDERREAPEPRGRRVAADLEPARAPGPRAEEEDGAGVRGCTRRTSTCRDA